MHRTSGRRTKRITATPPCTCSLLGRASAGMRAPVMVTHCMQRWAGLCRRGQDGADLLIIPSDAGALQALLYDLQAQ